MSGRSASGLLLLLLGVFGLSLFVTGNLDRALGALFNPTPLAATTTSASTGLPTATGERRQTSVA